MQNISILNVKWSNRCCFCRAKICDGSLQWNFMHNITLLQLQIILNVKRSKLQNMIFHTSMQTYLTWDITSMGPIWQKPIIPGLHVHRLILPTVIPPQRAQRLVLITGQIDEHPLATALTQLTTWKRPSHSNLWRYLKFAKEGRHHDIECPILTLESSG